MMTKRKFIPGTEWLYLKIYTGITTSDIILENCIARIVNIFENEGYLKNWFFIRYQDPQIHIRVRFELHSREYFTKIFKEINTAFDPYLESGEVLNILIDTYVREIERYGEISIIEAERLFRLSSDLVLKTLYLSDEQKIMSSIYYISMLLECLDISKEEKLQWLKNYDIYFKREFNADKTLNNQLSKKYNIFIKEYEDFILLNTDIKNSLDFCLQESMTIIRRVIKNNDIKLDNFLQSIFHMKINRFFNSEQRFFEMIVYDYLLRYQKQLKKDI